ncbi:hypothetical protein [Nocardioides plantarum]|uniref:50S ribosomal protein L29 n=1 Tax=Nocardioides plantarum TaxID=29299 RepID=A0ABV5K498_9ACTN|nr:hypothetical protein [Nocardioides plantarum]
MNAHELLDYEMRRTHADATVDHDARNRATLSASRRRARRHRLAARVRSVADRLEA